MNNVVHNTAWIPGHFHTTVGGPVFLSFIGMTLFLVTQLTGKRLRLPRLNLWVPYLWCGGMLVFSVGFSVAGLLGQPRRTNLGLTYSNPGSALFHPTWESWSRLGAIGGVIISFAMLCFFVVFFTTLFGPKEHDPAIVLPTSEVYHDADVGVLRNFTPWVVAALILLAIAYVPPLYEVVHGPTQAVPGYDPASPVAAAP